MWDEPEFELYLNPTYSQEQETSWMTSDHQRSITHLIVYEHEPSRKTVSLRLALILS